MSDLSVQQTLDTSTALIAHLLETLQARSPTLPPNTSNKPINPLALSSTAASLIKAQITKLTLLALNKPFTPSSIIQILNTICTSPLPALVTAVQICDPDKFSIFAQNELKNMASRLLKAYETLLAKIPTSEVAQESSIKSIAQSSPQSTDPNQKAALIGTGLVWEICDEVVAFSEQGLAEAAAKSMASYRALFNDALHEINQWLEQGKNDTGLPDELEDLTLEDANSDSASVVSFSSRPTKEVIPIADWILKVLKHLSLLYPPLIKRRFKKFPELKGKTSTDAIPYEQVAKLDQLLNAGRSWSEQIDFVAEALFENDADTATDRVKKLLQTTEASIDSVRCAWDGSEDELTVWLVQWTSKLEQLRTDNPP